MTPLTPLDTPLVPYADNTTYLADALRLVDQLLRLHLSGVRRTLAGQPSGNGAGLFIADATVDRLLADADSSDTAQADALEALLSSWAHTHTTGTQAAWEAGIFLGVPQLARVLRLSGLEVQVLLLCLAPELDRKYDTLYAYLQDDITRKRPSVDLVLDVLCSTPAERWAARQVFAEDASLFRSGILEAVDDPHSPSGSSGLARFLKVDARILHFILGHANLDGALQHVVRLYPPGAAPEAVDVEQLQAVCRLVDRYVTTATQERQKLTVYLQGPDGVGKQALAHAVCAYVQRPLLVVDAERLAAEGADAPQMFNRIFREGLLLQAGIYMAPADALKETPSLLHALAAAHDRYGWLTFLGHTATAFALKRWTGTVVQRIVLPVPPVPQRAQVWEHTLADGDEMQPHWPALLADRFRLPPGAIRQAVTLARQAALMRGDGPVTLDDLCAGARAQSNQKLAQLARHIRPRYDWAALILPDHQHQQLREIVAQVAHRYEVFGSWGFGRRFAHGRGLGVLFEGPSGTGKTMAAEVIAGALGLDLYKIDLSQVVSKYIGETEQNLSRIFDEAETSNAILFFDEADALFGKRTQISDARDRYANIETSYLLQKMEEYEGMVVLATNLRENMDDAFVRRIRFIVEFPFPDVEHRCRIWQTHFPEEAPVAEEVDCAFLARQFEIAGGNIKNIVLNAAFYAAEEATQHNANGQQEAEVKASINMAHLLQATRREYEKMGKLWNAQPFAQYMETP